MLLPASSSAENVLCAVAPVGSSRRHVCRSTRQLNNIRTPLGTSSVVAERPGPSSLLRYSKSPSSSLKRRGYCWRGRVRVEATRGSGLTAEKADGATSGSHPKASKWRGYYHTTGQAPPRLAFSEFWVNALATLPSSRVFRAILPAVLSLAAFSALVTYGYQCGLLTIKLIPTMHHLLGVPLGLLLVLRTTHAQERSWTARQSLQVRVMSANRFVYNAFGWQFVHRC
eukprot:scaffold337802_cov42-Prasinocladus_malaysianus.AAC.1